MTTLLPLLIALTVTVLAYRAVRRVPISSRLDTRFRTMGTRHESDPEFYEYQRELRDVTAVRIHEEDRRAA